MLQSYFRTAIRFLLKNKTFSFINIFGLAIGTLCCLYIILYVQDQYSYDSHHNEAKDIYRVITTMSQRGDKQHTMATASPPIAPAMKNDFPEVRQFTRVIPTLGASQHVLRYKDKAIYESQAALVDSTFFDVFTYHFVNGSPAKALTEPNSLVLSQSTADKLFGNEDPIGKIIQLDNAWEKHDLKVTGVINESLGKSHILAHLFISLHGYGDDFRKDAVWSGHNFASSYVKLQPNTNAAALESKLPAFLNQHAEQELKSRGLEKQLHLQPVASIHTTTGYGADGKTVSTSFLYVLLLIAALIQVIACINFMNLSTARASRRAKEVGVRKVIGAGKNRLILQFLSESFLLSILGMIIALVLLRMALPWLNRITDSDVNYANLDNWRIWILIAGIVTVTGLLAGSYPAFYLSAFDAIKVLKGNFTNHISVAGIRRSLVVFQFVLSIVLISVIVVIYSQLNYIKNKDLGFDKNQKLLFSFINADAKSKMPAFINDLNRLPEIKAVTMANNFPGNGSYHNWGVFLPGGNMSTSTNQSNIATDEHFLHATGIRLVSGRDFRPQDSGKVLINEALAKRLGLDARSAISARLFTEEAGRIHEVIGVMKDFNFRSLHESVAPFMLIYDPNAGDLFNIIANVDSKDYKASLEKIGQIWHTILPGVPFDYRFMDETVQKQYETEITLSNVINCFTCIAIFISCLGLFGLAAFSAEQRSKEIGIRKVLGASIPGVVRLLSKDFVKLVAVAIVIATPIAWWAMSRWLEAFAYRITVSWWMFALAGFLAMLIALITVSSQAIRAAIANPVRNLRSE